MTQFNEIFNRTDWELFGKQKQALVRSIQILCDEYPAEAENLEGMLNWIDYVQDLIAEGLNDQEVAKVFSYSNTGG